MTLEQIKDLIILISGENGQKFVYGPEDFADLLHLAQLKHFKLKLGLPEEYSPGNPLPRQAFEINQRITEDMRHFKVMLGWHQANPIDLDDHGRADYPNDYYLITDATYFYHHSEQEGTLERPIDILSDLEYKKRNTSIAMKPDKMFPVCNMQADHIRFSPHITEPINMVYLRLPKKPLYKVIDNDGFYEYDDSGSVNLEWDDMNIVDIITLVLGDIGIPLENQNVLQYAQNLKERGR